MCLKSKLTIQKSIQRIAFRLRFLILFFFLVSCLHFVEEPILDEQADPTISVLSNFEEELLGAEFHAQ